MSNLSETVVCPNRSETTFGFTPALSNSVAAVLLDHFIDLAHDAEIVSWRAPTIFGHATTASAFQKYLSLNADSTTGEVQRK